MQVEVLYQLPIQMHFMLLQSEMITHYLVYYIIIQLQKRLFIQINLLELVQFHMELIMEITCIGTFYYLIG